jgi:hypothetical protein
VTDNYAKIVRDNLNRLYDPLSTDLTHLLPADRKGEGFVFQAFGEKCIMAPEGISLGEKDHSSVFGILISLYALNARPDICIPEPFKAFKEFPDSMPYVSAFTTHTEKLLVPKVPLIEKSMGIITEAMGGGDTPPGTGGDFSILVYPLPKIALCYIFYEADEDFPPSVTCLYSNNANLFLPVAALADVGEYTSRKILTLIG